MLNRVDYLVVGSGLTGAVIARHLADAGREVLVVERRAHVGGNVHDHTHESGIRVHTYGPHYFRTSSERIWEFVGRFAQFYRYEAKVMTDIDGQLVSWPVLGRYIREQVGDDWKPTFTGKPSNFEEAALSLMPRVIYERFVKGYTEKQWGVPATQLDAELCKRFTVHHDDDPRFTPDRKYQGLPVPGYAAMMSRMLQGIEVRTNMHFDADESRGVAKRMLIYTGPIDAFFGYDLGRLDYRGQQRTHQWQADTDLKYPCGQVNNPSPQAGPHIRTLEWKHMMPPDAQPVRGTLLTRETPFTPDDPDSYEYPMPDQSNRKLYERYRQRADAMERVLIAGRLGEYRYYDMDQAIGRAMLLAERLLEV